MADRELETFYREHVRKLLDMKARLEAKLQSLTTKRRPKHKLSEKTNPDPKRQKKEKSELGGQRFFCFQLLLPTIARYLPASKRYFFVIALRQSESELFRNVAPRIVDDAIFDATGSGLTRDVDNKIKEMIFEDLRWTLTPSELSRVRDVKWLVKREFEDDIREMQPLFPSLQEEVYRLHHFFGSELGPTTLFVQAREFSKTMTCMYLAEYGLHSDFDNRKNIGILFYLNFLYMCKGKEYVDNILQKYWLTFVKHFGFMSLVPPKNVCENVLVPLLLRVITPRQIDFIFDIKTFYSRCEEFLTMAKYDDKLKALDAAYGVKFDSWQTMVTPPTVLALNALSKAEGHVINLPKIIKMDYKKIQGWTESARSNLRDYEVIKLCKENEGSNYGVTVAEHVTNDPHIPELYFSDNLNRWGF